MPHLLTEGRERSRLCGVKLYHATLYRLFERGGGCGRYIRERGSVSAFARLASPAAAPTRMMRILRFDLISRAPAFVHTFRRRFGMHAPAGVRACRPWTRRRCSATAPEMSDALLWLWKLAQESQ